MTEPEQRKFPTYALYHGKRVRVLYYLENGRFMVLNRHDQQVDVDRDQLTFLPEKGKSSGS